MDYRTHGAPPRLETERLVLQPHRREDFDDLSAMWSDPVVLQHITFAVQGRRENWTRLLRYGGCWPILGFGFWAVRHKETGRYAGDIGFGDLCREIEPTIDGIPEAGWVFATWAHGQGFANEALTAALAWLDTRTAYSKSVCLIAPENAPSLRLAARHGYVAPLSVTFNEEPAVLLTRQKPAQAN
jgi:RimJ/RimL family protein N-acetyltransferase